MAHLVYNSAEQYCECPYSQNLLDPTYQEPLKWDAANRYCTCPIPLMSVTDAQAAMVWSPASAACLCPSTVSCDPTTQAFLVWNPTLKFVSVRLTELNL